MSSFEFIACPAVVLLSLAAAAAATAHAESPLTEEQSSITFAQPKTRDQVQSELFAARASGLTKVWSISYDHMSAAKSLRTRSEVQAEAVAANKAGLDAAMLGEDSGSFEMARAQQPRLADRVVASR